MPLLPKEGIRYPRPLHCIGIPLDRSIWGEVASHTRLHMADNWLLLPPPLVQLRFANCFLPSQHETDSRLLQLSSALEVECPMDDVLQTWCFGSIRPIDPHHRH